MASCAVCSAGPEVRCASLCILRSSALCNSTWKFSIRFSLYFTLFVIGHSTWNLSVFYALCNRSFYVESLYFTLFVIGHSTWNLSVLYFTLFVIGHSTWKFYI